MTKLYFEPIRVECDEGDRPRLFFWRSRIHRVNVLKRWIVCVDWWRQEISRQYYRVESDDLGMYEIYRERDRWFLERLYD